MLVNSRLLPEYPKISRSASTLLNWYSLRISLIDIRGPSIIEINIIE